MAEGRTRQRFNLFARTTRAVTGISIIVGIGAAIFGMFSTLRSWKYAQLDGINQFINEDTDLSKELYSFSNKYQGAEGKAKLLDALHRYGDCSTAYHSEELAELRELGRHYEKIGALVKYHYINFDLIYEVIPFPDAFWSETDVVRNEARKNWDSSGGKPEGLDDFWQNFEYLRAQYVKARIKDCVKSGKDKETCKAKIQ